MVEEIPPELAEIVKTYVRLVTEKGFTSLEATRALRKLKPHYTEIQIARATSLAKEHFVKPTPEDLADMKREFAAWECEAIHSWPN